MKNNKYGYLGFISLVGFLGYFYNDASLYGFFGFAYFFCDFFVVPDEMFMANMKKSGTWAFVTSLSFWAIFTAVFTVFDIGLNPNAMALGLAYSMGIFVFAVSKSVLVGVRRETIGNLESGKYNPSLKLAMDIAVVLQCTIEELFEFVD